MLSPCNTPIQELTLNINENKLFIKRDDLIPYSFGGNKVRKAILFFEEIAKQQNDCVVTYGTSSSNHCRIIANFAQTEGLKCFIISPEQSLKNTSNSRIMKLLGAEIISCDISLVKETIESTLAKLKKIGFNPYFIPGGGHGNHGTEAYVKGYQEIKEYEKNNFIHFDYIFHTSGTGTTQAGLICGKIFNNDNRKIIGISNARKNPYGRDIVLDSVNSYLLEKEEELVSADEVTFVDDYVLEGYGSYNQEILSLIKDIMRIEGIPLDTTYTGKSFWGMKEYIKENNIINKNILFIHTGGTPLFFDDMEVLMNE